MNVNEKKGVTGLIEVIRDLNRKGYECFTPFNDFSAVVDCPLYRIHGCDIGERCAPVVKRVRGAIDDRHDHEVCWTERCAPENQWLLLS